MTTTTTTTLMPTLTTETVLIGTSTNALVNVEYTINGADVVDIINVGSPVAGILYGEGTNKAYISTNSNLYSYGISYYINTHETQKLIDIGNTDNAIISAYRKNDNSLWSIQSYNGKVAKMNTSDLSIIKTYDGFDAPYKIRYSPFHNSYFISGSNVLWKIDSLDNISSVYEINGYILKDFDVSEDGLICMLFNGNSDSIIRIISGDQYKIVLDERIDVGMTAFCRYCNAGRFYVLVELNTGGTEYSAVHYLFNSSTGILDMVDSRNAAMVTTTTTTPGTTTKAVKVSSPNGGESIQIGQKYSIQWISSKGINDAVKIELYKGNDLYDVIVENTVNNGTFNWDVSSNIQIGDNYKIKITWLSNSSDSNNYDFSANYFGIGVSVTTTTTTTKMTERAIGVDYSQASDQILIVLSSGLYMVFVLPTMTVYGLLSLGVSNPYVMATRSMVINGFGEQAKARIFVGSEKYWSDKWDSGIVQTNLKSCYYGGGNNLDAGEKYFVHIQTYSNSYGWSELQITDFVMPK